MSDPLRNRVYTKKSMEAAARGEGPGYEVRGKNAPDEVMGGMKSGVKKMVGGMKRMLRTDSGVMKVGYMDVLKDKGLKIEKKGAGYRKK